MGMKTKKTPPHLHRWVILPLLVLSLIVSVFPTLTVDAADYSWEAHVRHFVDGIPRVSASSLQASYEWARSGGQCNKCGHASLTVDEYVAPTCSSGGRLRIHCTCVDCTTIWGDRIHGACAQIGSQTAEATGHNYHGNITILSTGTCTTGGSIRVQCTSCNNSQTYSVDAMGHAFDKYTYASTVGTHTTVSPLSTVVNGSDFDIEDGHLSVDCVRDGAHDHDEYLYEVYVRYMNANGTWGSYAKDTSRSKYYKSGSTLSYSREEDSNYLSISYTTKTTTSPGIVYIDVTRKGYTVNYNNNGGTGTIAPDYFIYGLRYNLNDGRAFNRYHSELLGWSVNASVNRSLTATPTYRLGQEVTNLTLPGGTVNMYAVWRPWYYYVTYHNNLPGVEDVTTTRNNVKYEYDIDYTPMAWSEASALPGFTRNGYYIESWSTSRQAAGTGYNCANPYSAVGKSTFNNLALDTETANLYAIWKGNPYKIVIHDNYRNCACPNEVHNVNVGTNFALPTHANTHGSSAKLIGYSYTSVYKENPEFSVSQIVKDLTLTANKDIHLYRIWDEVPKVTSPATIMFSRERAVSSGVVFNADGSVKQSDLEIYLMTFATATDEEHGGNIPAGTQNGYTFKIGSIDPVKMQEDLDHVTNYIVTYVCIDPVGNWAQSQTELYFGDDWVSILHDTK